MSQLFLWDEPKVERAESIPVDCPWCGETEPNSWSLGNNHWVPSPWADQHGMCIAMDLTRNHVIYDARKVREPDEKPSCADHRRCPVECAQDRLARSIERAREVWPAERLDWLDAVLSDAA